MNPLSIFLKEKDVVVVEGQLPAQQNEHDNSGAPDIDLWSEYSLNDQSEPPSMPSLSDLLPEMTSGAA